MRKIEFLATVLEGGISPLSSNTAKRMLKLFEGFDVIITVEKYRKDRSSRQNRYYWGVVIPLFMKFHKDNTGERLSKEVAHQYICQNILGAELVEKEVSGLKVYVFEFKRLSECSTVEFEDRMEIIRQYFSPLGLVIPEPNQENFTEQF